MGNQSTYMKKLICILAGAALLAACEQKTETVAPAASPAPGKTENNTTVVNPVTGTEKTKETNTTNTTNTTTAVSTPATSSSTKTESTSTTTSSPTP